jgi:inosine triphosphate pyrophosphatase
MKIKFVTGNKDKFKEAQAIIPELEMLDIDLPEIQTLDYQELISNKLEKARKVSDEIVVVEDQQMGIKSLNGLPGPFIRWFLKTLGVRGLSDLVHKYDNHDVIVSTVIGVAYNNDVQFFKSSVTGQIVQPRGTNGWGWDPIFEIDELKKTFAELTFEEKNEVSMRRKVFEQLKIYLSKNYE